MSKCTHRKIWQILAKMRVLKSQKSCHILNARTVSWRALQDHRQLHIQTRLYCVEWHNTVFARSGPLSVHKLFTSCIRWCLVSRACDWVISALSAVLHIFSFQFSLLFFHISIARQHQHCGVGLLLVLIRNIGHRTLPKIWVATFPVRSV